MKRIATKHGEISGDRIIEFTVLAKYDLSPAKLQKELRVRLSQYATEHKLPVNPDWIEGSIIIGPTVVPNIPRKFIIAYVESVDGIEKIILEILQGIEAEIDEAAKINRMLDFIL